MAIATRNKYSSKVSRKKKSKAVQKFRNKSIKVTEKRIKRL